jgi:ATP-binding cassette subfamily F protein uup
VLRDLGMRVNAGARIGLGNGVGKSTVLRLLAGTEEVDAGEVARRRGLSVASLPQYIEGDERSTPMEVVRAAGDLGAPGRASSLRGAARLVQDGDRSAQDATGAGASGWRAS